MMASFQMFRSLLVANLAVVFLPMLLVQVAAPTFMRGRTSPVPGGALLGALVVLLLAAASFRVALARARRAAAYTPAHEMRRGEIAGLVSGALLVILLGQSLLAGLADLIEVVQPATSAGAVGHAINYPRYLVITGLAYIWTVAVLTLLAVCLATGSSRAAVPASLGVPLRRASVAAIVVVLAAAVVFALKVVQHLG